MLVFGFPRVCGISFCCWFRNHPSHTGLKEVFPCPSSVNGIAQVGAVARELLCQQLGLLGALMIGCRRVVCAL
jgi:hypothetical protein